MIILIFSLSALDLHVIGKFQSDDDRRNLLEEGAITPISSGALQTPEMELPLMFWITNSVFSGILSNAMEVRLCLFEPHNWRSNGGVESQEVFSFGEQG
jgi:hypothetical protein